MVIRRMYAAYADKETVFTDKGDARVKHLSLTRYEDIVFLYYEATEEVAPTDAVSGATRPFPDGSLWFFMPDIFHYSRPLSEEHWERKTEKKPFVRLNRLLPEKVGSYIYYHQQLQEEYPGLGDKYGIIGLFGTYIYFYCELPEEPETEKITGALQTKNSPMGEAWNTLMGTHFRGWDDITSPWREIETLLFR